ncbi:MAG: MFS transporter [Planctomycetia bacterium]|nr:MFS transporter [Planctomycetia bacterium]
MASSTLPRRRLTAVEWLICVIASIGFAFDIYELLMLPLILRPALVELIGAAPGSSEFAMWRGILFFVPAFVGGLFGLVGGYLTDRLGRRRVLTWSILLYAFSAFAGGFSTSIWMLLVLRSTKFIGVCVEFVAAVAWLAELFPEPARRERVLGYTQAFSSIGGLLVAGANSLALAFSDKLPAIAIPDFATSLLGSIDPAHQHEAWRYTMMSGLIPAIPLIFIRPFLPESPIWAQKKMAGTLKRPSLMELFRPELRRTTLVTTLIFACSYGAAFGAIQQIPQIVPGLSEVVEKVKDMPKPKQRAEEQAIAADVTKVQEIGGLVGRILLAVLAVRIVSRQKLLRLFQVPGLAIVPAVFAYAAVHSLTLLYVGIFFAGLVTVAQFSFWGNYLPRVYPVHLRGTGESFAANIGGRMIGTSFAWVTSAIAALPFVPGGSDPAKMAYTSAGVALFVYAVGLVASFWLPEPGEEDLPE